MIYLFSACIEVILFILPHYPYSVVDCVNPLSSLNRSSEKGGMFGYSISSSSLSDISSGQEVIRYISVGQPWDAQVHIYSSTTKLNPSNVSRSFGDLPEDSINWSYVQTIADSGNGTWPGRSRSLFGYSVSLSEDGMWLAVGIPGRSFTNLSRFVSLQFHSFAGSVRLYRFDRVSKKFQFVMEVRNPNGNAFWQKFGNKVMIRMATAGEYDYQLFVGTNAGWDGASTKFYEADVDNPKWPVDPKNMTGAGIYYYEINDSDQTVRNPVLKNQQFIPIRSAVPLGSLGIEFEVISTVDGKCNLFVRDFILPVQYASVYETQCPFKNCSFITVTSKDGSKTLVNSTGVVIQYSKGETGFSQTNIFSRSDFSLDGKLTIGWDKSDWFGSSISVQYDRLYRRYLLAIGAPRFSVGVFTYYSTNEMKSWQISELIPNPVKSKYSFFGQTIQFASEGKFLIISDPVDSPTLRFGTSYLYHRRSEYEYLPEYADLVEDISFEKVKYDLIGLTQHIGEMSDQFGFAISAGSDLIAIGSHVSDCVFFYKIPNVTETGSPPQIPDVDNGIEPPKEPDNPNNGDSLLDKKNGWKIGVIVGIVGSFMGLLVFFGMFRYHKLRVLKELQEKALMQFRSSREFSPVLLGEEDESIPGSSEAIFPN